MSYFYPLLEHARVAELAYRYWEERGRPEGSPEIDWRRAVARLVGEANERLEESVVSSLGMGKRTF
jgi:hypothetical protein